MSRLAHLAAAAVFTAVAVLSVASLAAASPPDSASGAPCDKALCFVSLF